jgi:hypothetical protein
MAMARVLGVLVAALVAWGSVAQADEHGVLGFDRRWQQLENNPSCAVWNPNPQPNESVTWSGACANAMAQGRGTSALRVLIEGEWKKKSEFTGEMKDGKKHGRGFLVWANGNSYEGNFKDGKQHGHGVYVKANGVRYEGDFKNGKRHGRGVLA